MTKFQSTHPRGVRPSATPSASAYKKISIHAPARGATCYDEGFIQVGGYFNPRTREGCDLCTSPQPAAAYNFNPRTREGCDIYWNENEKKGEKISIHAPARGATSCVRRILFKVTISIHAPARGATRARHVFRQKLFISIHAPARGATWILK